ARTLGVASSHRPTVVNVRRVATTPLRLARAGAEYGGVLWLGTTPRFVVAGAAQRPQDGPPRRPTAGAVGGPGRPGVGVMLGVRYDGDDMAHSPSGSLPGAGVRLPGVIVEGESVSYPPVRARCGARCFCPVQKAKAMPAWLVPPQTRQNFLSR